MCVNENIHQINKYTHQEREREKESEKYISKSIIYSYHNRGICGRHYLTPIVIEKNEIVLIH